MTSHRILRKSISKRALRLRSGSKNPKKTFVIAPFMHAGSQGHAKEIGKWEGTQGLTRELMAICEGNAGVPEMLSLMGVAEIKPQGLIVNHLDFLGPKTEPTLALLLETMFPIFNCQNPHHFQKAHQESLVIVRQLIELGHLVKVQDPGVANREPFIQAAESRGAQRTPCPSNQHLQNNTIWARDQWVKIGKKKEYVENPDELIGDMNAILAQASRRGGDFPKETLMNRLASFKSSFFGEGGSMVPVAPKGFAIAAEINQDPRTEVYEGKGYQFQTMPRGAMYDLAASALLDTRVYTITNHVDLLIGALPERKIVAIDPYYYKNRRLSVDLLVNNFDLTPIFVPETEADRHPANFLPLGRGRVLVDSGAPEFIQMLSEAGATVIPTGVPLDYLMGLKGALRCLFNED